MTWNRLLSSSCGVQEPSFFCLLALWHMQIDITQAWHQPRCSRATTSYYLLYHASCLMTHRSMHTDVMLCTEPRHCSLSPSFPGLYKRVVSAFLLLAERKPLHSSATSYARTQSSHGSTTNRGSSRNNVIRARCAIPQPTTARAFIVRRPG